MKTLILILNILISSHISIIILNDKWSVSFLGYWSKNDYEMIPNYKEVDFGSVQQPIKLLVGYEGKEDDSL